METSVNVILDSQNKSQISRSIKFEPEKSLNHFRRECSKTFQVDVLTLYLQNGELVTDPFDIKCNQQVIASPHFSLNNPFLIQSVKISPFEAENSTVSTDCFEYKNTVIKVEILSHGDSGKTSLIQTFIHEYCQREKHSVIEAVYRKKVDIRSTLFEFLVVDSLESAETDLEDRLRNKQAVIIACSKEKFIDAIEHNSVESLRAWLVGSAKKARMTNSAVFVCLAVTKSDILSEIDAIFEGILSLLVCEFPVFRVSVMDDVLDDEVYNPLQLFNIIGETISRELERKKWSTRLRMSRLTRKADAIKRGEVTGWFRGLKRMLSCFSYFGYH